MLRDMLDNNDPSIMMTFHIKVPQFIDFKNHLHAIINHTCTCIYSHIEPLHPSLKREMI